ncbi:MAG: molybdate ABC transporter substrate-binding protein [Nitrospirae bacterium]|nr:molybdate ABC transporter substrate-binding protein [Nitrospirota bacterium]
MVFLNNSEQSVIKISLSKILLIVLGVVLYFPGQAAAEDIRAAVATNFLATFKAIVKQFEQRTGHTVVMSSGSSGKLYAQIRNGAPFDLFFSADVRRPQLLEQEGLAVRGTRFTYAEGRITLWSRDPTLINGNGKPVLSSQQFTHLAMANPKTAPYGKAAQQTLEALGMWARVKSKIVRGENIGQAFQFVYSKNAQLGFVALSQVLDPKIQGQGSRWDVPTDFYEPLHQQAVLLVKAKDSEGAKVFLQFVQHESSRKIIKEYGYGVE